MRNHTTSVTYFARKHFIVSAKDWRTNRTEKKKIKIHMEVCYRRTRLGNNEIHNIIISFILIIFYLFGLVDYWYSLNGSFRQFV